MVQAFARRPESASTPNWTIYATNGSGDVKAAEGQHLAVMNEATTYLDQAYQPSEIERQVDLMAKLDARIEKVIRRLTAIKVFKGVDGVQAPYAISPGIPLVVPVDNSMEKAPAKAGESTEARENERANRRAAAQAALRTSRKA